MSPSLCAAQNGQWNIGSFFFFKKKSQTIAKQPLYISTVPAKIAPFKKSHLMRSMDRPEWEATLSKFLARFYAYRKIFFFQADSSLLEKTRVQR